MSVYLLDVNALIALMWPAHEAHETVLQWFRRYSQQGWATCPLTEAGFVRIVSNPAFSPDALTPAGALAVLGANQRHKHHRFWKDEIGLASAIKPFRDRVVTARQVTDAYLLGLAGRKGGRLATLDRRMKALLVPGTKETLAVIR